MLPIAGTRGIPGSAKSVSVNITVTDATTAGYVTAYPCGDAAEHVERQLRDRSACCNGAMLKLSGSGSCASTPPATRTSSST